MVRVLEFHISFLMNGKHLFWQSKIRHLGISLNNRLRNAIDRNHTSSHFINQL